MRVKGIILDEMNLEQIRLNGFTDFRVLDGEMHWEDEAEKYQPWCIKKGEEIEAFSMDYMMGQDDAKLFYFSDKADVIEKIASVFPACQVIEVESDDYPLDYDYTRDATPGMAP